MSRDPRYDILFDLTTLSTTSSLLFVQDAIDPPGFARNELQQNPRGTFWPASTLLPVADSGDGKAVPLRELPLREV